MFLGVSLSLTGQLRAGGALSAYAIGSFEPDLVFDFEQEYYRTGGTQTTFDSAMTLDRDGNATMVDSDGLLKWAPHNLVTYSEDLTGTGWGIIGSGTIDDAFTVSISDTAALSSALAATQVGAAYTIEVELWTETDVGEQVDIGFNTNNLSNTFSAPITLTATPTTYSFSKSNNTATQNGFRLRNVGGTAKTVKVRNVRVYRSDLGGMVDNPDRGDSYVPTTSAARYLPRRGHHVYNGAEWVNEGVLVEPSAGTNLITYSEDFTDASWIPNGDTSPFTAPDATGPDGKTSAFTMVDNGAGGTGSNLDVFQAVTVATNTAYTASIFAKADQISFLYIRASGFTTPSNGNVWFDLGNGTVGTEQSTLSGTIEDYGNGWYRCAVTFITDVADTSGLLQFGASEADASESVDLDGTSSILIYGAQHEAGSVPSSYIPTSGSTVTRAADTLTVPSANLPWPTPNVIGPELVTNGDFSYDGDWTLDAASSISGGVLSTTKTNAGEIASQAIPITAGKVYLIEYTVLSTNGQVIVPRLSGNPASSAPATTTTGTFQAVVTAVSDINKFAFNVSGSGLTATIDNISVREIDPLAVSIQMEGRMTYADTGVNNESTFINWAKDGNDSIITRLDTPVQLTGRVTFTQRSAGVLDVVLGSNSDYSPGINQSFNIASRHGSTFVNGAVDGTALTANTTPTALPDLSTTDLSLATTGGPMILKKVRIWAADIEDAGISEAST